MVEWKKSLFYKLTFQIVVFKMPEWGKLIFHSVNNCHRPGPAMNMPALIDKG